MRGLKFFLRYRCCVVGARLSTADPDEWEISVLSTRYLEAAVRGPDGGLSDNIQIQSTPAARESSSASKPDSLYSPRPAEPRECQDFINFLVRQLLPSTCLSSGLVDRDHDRPSLAVRTVTSMALEHCGRLETY